jgi:hypothetical protein
MEWPVSLKNYLRELLGQVVHLCCCACHAIAENQHRAAWVPLPIVYQRIDFRRESWCPMRFS